MSIAGNLLLGCDERCWCVNYLSGFPFIFDSKKYGN